MNRYKCKVLVLFGFLMSYYTSEMMGQFAPSFQIGYNNHQQMNLAGQKTSVGLSYSTKKNTIVEVQVYTSYQQGDYIGDKIQNVTNYFTHDDFPDNFKASTLGGTQSTSAYSEVYSSKKKDNGIELNVGKRFIMKNLIVFTATGSLGSRYSEANIWLADNPLNLRPLSLDPLIKSDTIVPIVYPNHLFYAIYEWYIGGTLGVGVKLFNRVELTSIANITQSINKGGLDYTLGLKLSVPIKTTK